jgi:hypothetical protein
MSASDATTVAENAFIASEFLFNTSGIATHYIPGISGGTPAPDAAGLALALMEFAWGDLRLSSSPTQGIVQACPSGGSLTSVASKSSTGNLLDTVDIVASNCVMNGFTMNGHLTARVVSQSGSPFAGQAWDATDFFRFSHFSAANTTASAEFDGDLTLAMSFTPSGTRAYTVSGAAMHLTAKRNGQAPVDASMQQYKTVTNFAPGEIRSTIAFTQQRIGGLGQAITVAVETPQSFVRNAGQYPSAGILSVSGGGSSASVNAIDGTNLRFDFSAAGDGVVTESKNMTWSQLLFPL